MPGYAPVLTYRYRVDGHTYQADSFSHSSAHPGATLATAEDALRDYLENPFYAPWQPGQTVTVHYNPKNPAEAVLQPRSLFLPLGLLGLGLLLIAGAASEARRIRAAVPPSGGNAPSAK